MWSAWAGWRRLPGFMTSVLVVLLSACAGNDLEPSPSCPQARFLDGADRTTVYRPDAPAQPKQVQYLAVLTGLSSACAFRDEGVDVSLDFKLIAERGPGHQGEPIVVTYFVATMAPPDQLLAKQVFDSAIEFEDSRQRAGVQESLTLRLPNITEAAAPGYTLYLGLQFDPDDFQRRRPKPF